jgi:hypothetical protein
MNSPCIQIVPIDPSKPAFALCGSQSDNVISTRAALLLSDDERRAWTCPKCARRYRPRVAPFVPPDMKPAVYPSAP